MEADVVLTERSLVQFHGGVFVSLSVESILVSVISMLASPNLDSPANVDAAVSRVESLQRGGVGFAMWQVEFKKDYPAYKKKVRRLVLF